MLAAIGAMARPMEMITGPITTGGSMRSMKPVPLIFTISPMKVYTKPAAITPPMVSARPNWPLARMIGVMKAKLEARNTGT